MITIGRLILLLTGLLIGAFTAAFLANSALGLNAATLILLTIAVIFILKLLNQPDNGWLLAGVIAGLLLCLLIPALSMGFVSAEVAALALIVLAVK